MSNDMENQSNDEISSDVRLIIGSKRETLDHSGKDCHHQTMPQSLVKATVIKTSFNYLLTLNKNHHTLIESLISLIETVIT